MDDVFGLKIGHSRDQFLDFHFIHWGLSEAHLAEYAYGGFDPHVYKYESYNDLKHKKELYPLK